MFHGLERADDLQICLLLDMDSDVRNVYKKLRIFFNFFDRKLRNYSYC
jgi:hypothetical protein